MPRPRTGTPRRSPTVRSRPPRRRVEAITARIARPKTPAYATRCAATPNLAISTAPAIPSSQYARPSQEAAQPHREPRVAEPRPGPDREYQPLDREQHLRRPALVQIAPAQHAGEHEQPADHHAAQGQSGQAQCETRHRHRDQCRAERLQTGDRAVLDDAHRLPSRPARRPRRRPRSTAPAGPMPGVKRRQATRSSDHVAIDLDQAAHADLRGE